MNLAAALPVNAGALCAGLRNSRFEDVVPAR